MAYSNFPKSKFERPYNPNSAAYTQPSLEDGGFYCDFDSVRTKQILKSNNPKQPAKNLFVTVLQKNFRQQVEHATTLVITGSPLAGDRSVED